MQFSPFHEHQSNNNSRELSCRPCHLKPNSCAATLPPEIWNKVWDGLDKGFFPTGHPEIHQGGACKCGKLKFQVDGTLAAAFLCHCHMCRMYWSQMCPTHTLWVQPATAVSVTAGNEHVKSWTVEKLSRNLRGQANVNFCGNCGTPINVEFSDPNGTFTLMWPYNFTAKEWGDTSGKGDKARHGDFEMFRPRFHAHYENRSCDAEDDLPKLADIWLEGLPTMNNAGEVIGKVKYPMPGFEQGWEKAKWLGHPNSMKSLTAPVAAASPSASSSPATMQKDLFEAMSAGKLPADMAAEFFVQYESKKIRAKL